MLDGREISPGVATDGSLVPTVHLRRIPVDATWPKAPPALEDRVLDDWLPERVELRERLQNSVDALQTQAVVLDGRGEIVVVNRVWRMTADLHGMSDRRRGIGRNYLSICRNAAVEGCRDSTVVAGGIESLLDGRCRSFAYKYACRLQQETRYFALSARRTTGDGYGYVVVEHELIEVFVPAT